MNGTQGSDLCRQNGRGWLALAAVAVAVVFVVLTPAPAAADVGDVKAIPLAESVGGLADMAAGPDGNLWVVAIAGIGNHVGRLTLDGEYTEFEIGSSANTDARIVAGPDGALWFTEWNLALSAIGRISTDGVYTRHELEQGAQPTGITVGPDDALWFTEGGANQIGRITTDGTITTFDVSDEITNPRAIATADDDSLWVAAGSQLRRVTTRGDIVETIDLGFEAVNLDTAPDGRLWMAGSSFGLVAVLEDDQTVTRFPIQGSGSIPDVEVDTLGNVWVTATDLLGNGALAIQLDPDTGDLTRIESDLEFGAGQGLTLGPDDQIWVIQSQFAQSPGANGKVVSRVLTGAPIASNEPTNEPTTFGAIATPLEALTLENVAHSAWISLVVVVLVLFPTQLVNSSIDAAYPRLAVRRTGPRAPVWHRRWMIRAFVVATALIYTLQAVINEVRFDSGTAMGRVIVTALAGFGAGIAVTTAVDNFVSARIAQRAGSTGGPVAKPATLPVALACVAISAAVGFKPGFVYGVVIAFVIRPELDETDEVRRIRRATLVVYTAAVLAWTLTEAFTRDSLPWIICAGVFVAGVEAAFLGLVPLKFLPGHVLWRAGWRVWLRHWSFGVYLFVLGILAPGVDGPDALDPAAAVALVVGFNVVAAVVWLLARRTDRASPDDGRDSVEVRRTLPR